MFSRPHVRAANGEVDIAVSLAELRQLSSYEALLQALEAEIAEVYGARFALLKDEGILYSLRNSSTQFGNELNRRLFDLLRRFDATHATGIQLRAEHEAIEASRPPPKVHEPKFDENGEEIPPPPKSKKAQREEAEQKKQDAERLKKVLQTEHSAACDAVKLANLFEVHSLRIRVSS